MNKPYYGAVFWAVVLAVVLGFLIKNVVAP